MRPFITAMFTYDDVTMYFSLKRSDYTVVFKSAELRELFFETLWQAITKLTKLKDKK